MTRVLGVLLFALAAAPAAARECGDGRIAGGLSASGDALQNYECALLARMYCRIAEDRDLGLAQADATQRTVDWLQRQNSTGTHLKGNWQPVVTLAAADVYRHKERPPGPTFYRTAYACGVAKRIPDDASAQGRAVRDFDSAADRCEDRHRLKGKRSFPNPDLRDCLANAVDQVTAAAGTR